jgi:hypothetical protein
LEEIAAAPVKKTETNDRGGSVVLTTQHPLSAKVGTASPTSGGPSVGIVRLRTKATEFFFYMLRGYVISDLSVEHFIKQIL